MLPPLFKLTWPSGGKGNGMRVKRPLWASMSLLVKDRGWTGQAQSFLASLTVCGWAYGEHPVTVTIKETACCLINCKRCWWSGTLRFRRIICSPLYGGTQQWRTDRWSSSLHIPGKKQPEEKPYFSLPTEEHDETSLLSLLLNSPRCQQICPRAVFWAVSSWPPIGK